MNNWQSSGRSTISTTSALVQQEGAARGGPSSRGTISGAGAMRGARTGVGARVTGAVGRAPDTSGAPDTTGTGDAGTGTNTCAGYARTSGALREAWLTGVWSGKCSAFGQTYE